MRRIVKTGLLLALVVSSCSKKEDNPSVTSSSIKLECKSGKADGHSYLNSITATIEGYSVQSLEFYGYDRNDQVVSMGNTNGVLAFVNSQGSTRADWSEKLAEIENTIATSISNPINPITLDFNGNAMLNHEIVLNGITFDWKVKDEISDVRKVVDLLNLLGPEAIDDMSFEDAKKYLQILVDNLNLKELLEKLGLSIDLENMEGSAFEPIKNVLKSFLSSGLLSSIDYILSKSTTSGIVWAYDNGDLWVEGANADKFLEKAQEARNAASDSIMRLLGYLGGFSGSIEIANPIPFVKCLLADGQIVGNIKKIIEAIKEKDFLVLITVIPAIIDEVTTCKSAEVSLTVLKASPIDNIMNGLGGKIDTLFDLSCEIARLNSEADFFTNIARDIESNGKYINPRGFTLIDNEATDIQEYSKISSVISNSVSARITPMQAGNYYFCTYEQYGKVVRYGAIKSFSVKNLSMGKITEKNIQQGKIEYTWELTNGEVESLLKKGIISIRAKGNIDGVGCISNSIPLAE